MHTREMKHNGVMKRFGSALPEIVQQDDIA